MNRRHLMQLGSALAIAAAVAGGAMASAADRDARAAKQARDDAAKASKALARNKADEAVGLAEDAVSLAPQDAGYRTLLGQSYLKAGRFTSARQALGDAVALDPANGRAALSLSLAQIAGGDWDGARKTLDAHVDTIPARDRGLAMALAGDPNAAVELLTTAARSGDSDAKTRQNLALALALSGRWPEAKAVAAVDLPADQLDKRILAWVSFAKPHGAADQVAALLGVSPVEDAGQPSRLALNAPATPVALAAQTSPEPTVAAPVAAQPLAAPVAEVVQSAALPAPAPEAKPGIVFAEPKEVAQALPAVVAAAPRATKPKAVAVAERLALAAKPKAVAPATLAKGNFVVQLGAYDSDGVARDAWKRAAARYAGLQGHAPSTVTVHVRNASFARLSVGSFARSDAVSLCLAIRAKGGSCFVRAGAGDKLASWAKAKAPQLAMR